MAVTRMNLDPAFFGAKPRLLVKSGSFSATTFRYDSGVCGLRLENGLGALVVLPFQGQQIWSAAFGGRELTMQSMFSEPRPTRQYLETYGGFFLHCGATAMGVPTGEDTHPLHGELPNAPYQQAHIELGEDQTGAYIGIGGGYSHVVAFSCSYVAQPLVQLHAGSSVFRVSMTLRNLKQSEMEWMYLAHINFRPVDHGRLVYSAPCDPEHVRVRKVIPAHVTPAPGYAEFLAELEAHPEKHNVLTPDLQFDPEVCLYIDYAADAEGWAHSMQVHPDGSADYVAHRPEQLPKGIRWISRTPDQGALGIVLPATAEPEGYHAEKAKGNIRVLPAGGAARLDMRVGTLSPEEAEAMAGVIDTCRD